MRPRHDAGENRRRVKYERQHPAASMRPRHDAGENLATVLAHIPLFSLQ